MTLPPLEPCQSRVAVTDPSGIAEARRRAGNAARALGFTGVQEGRVAIVASEMASNLIKHAGTGEVILGHRVGGGRVLLELLAIDRGPGIEDVARAMADGMSTTGTSGNGLGAMRRLSSEFDVASRAGGGTVVFAALAAVETDARPGGRPGPLQGVVCLPILGETSCGDAWAVEPHADGFRVVVADGLGHGPEAARASHAALAAIASTPQLGPAAAIQAAHGALRATRGAAVSVADVGHAAGTVTAACVGNVMVSVLEGTSHRRMASTNGTVGYGTFRAKDFTEAFPPGATLVLNSDGLLTRWTADGHPGILSRHPALLSALLYRDHARGRDDVTVLSVRAA